MAERRSVLDALDRLAPGLPKFERDVVSDHAVTSPGLRRATAEEAAWLSLVAFVRHNLTEYNDLLADGYDVDAARFAVAEEMTAILRQWGVKRRL